MTNAEETLVIEHAGLKLEVPRDAALRSLSEPAAPKADMSGERIAISIDGTAACALLGDDLQSGIAEFAPIEGDSYKQRHAAMFIAYEKLVERIGQRLPFDVVRDHDSQSEPAAQVGETPRTVPVWIKSLVMQVNERVAEDATTRCTLDMENASNAVRDWQAQERELAQMAKRVSELEAKLAEKSKEVARWEKMYVCAQNSNSFRQDALDGK